MAVLSIPDDLSVGSATVTGVIAVRLRSDPMNYGFLQIAIGFARSPTRRFERNEN
jgi:hypothetical protein